MQSAKSHRADNPDCLPGGFLIHRRMAAPHTPSQPSLNPPPEPPPVSEGMARAHQRYWRFNLALIAVLMTLGFLVSFVVPLAAPALVQMRFAGFSLPFYLGAQGAILVYVGLIVVYIVLMRRADRTLQRAFDADAAVADPSAARGN
jgi:putative solute:sodium symporter small subunit